MKIQYQFLSLLLIVLMGCQKESLVKVTAIPSVPFVWSYYIEGNSKIYAMASTIEDIYEENSVIANNDNPLWEDDRFQINLRKGNLQLEQFKHFIYEDTTTILDSRDGMPFEFDTISFTSRPALFNYYTHIPDSNIDQVGDIFDLSIQHPEFGDMSARQVMPLKVPLENAQVLKIYNGPNGLYQADVQLTIKDLGNIPNYYQVAGAVIPSDDNGNLLIDDLDILPFEIGADDPEIIDNENVLNRGAIYLADTSFDGQEKTINFWIDIGEPTLPENLYIIWRCISPEWYRFYEARRAAFDNTRINDNISNTLTQAYTLPFNIEGGYGLFGVATQELYRLN